MRSDSRPASNPASNSREISGVRLGFPVAVSIAPTSSTPSFLEGAGEKKEFGWRNDGRTPDSPYAVRSRSELTSEDLGKNGSSPITHDRLASGYVVHDPLASALFLSVRTAPVRNTLSRHASCC